MLQPLMHLLSSKRLVLASSSPRRKSILENIGLNIEIYPSRFEENIPREQFPIVWEYAIATARGKAYDVWNRIKLDGGSPQPELIIGADTVVSMEVDGELFGKPESEKSAKETLSRMAGRHHYVYTGVVLLWKPETESDQVVEDSFYEVTKVQMAPLSEEIISAYIKTGEPMDKAGSYGIQFLGGTLVEGIQGDFFNVVGLPLHHFCKRVSHHYQQQHQDRSR